MRFALCDEDRLYTTMIEVMVTDLGHEVVGVAATTADSVALVEAARPDVVIVDLSLGFNSDFDVVAAAGAVGAATIVFSQQADDAILSRYEVRPIVVYKPDLAKLEQVVERLGRGAADLVAQQERRTRPGRAARGPEPTGISDTQAFYGALNEATAGDALLSVELAEGAVHADMVEVAIRVRAVMRDTDRLVTSPRTVRVFLAGGGVEGLSSLRARMERADALPSGVTIRSVVIGEGEGPADAFDRLKTADPS